MNPMPSLQIRELPEDVYEALSYRAKQAGRSLAQQAVVELRRLTQGGDRSRRQQVLDEIAARPRRDTTGWPSPEEMIRRDRER